MELRGRGLLTHEAEDFRERGFSGSLAWDPHALHFARPGADSHPNCRRRGLRRCRCPARARHAGGPRGTAGSAAGDDGDLQHRRLEARLGYGFPAWGGRFASVPEIGFGLSDTGREYILGWRLMDEGPGAFRLSAEARRHETDGGNRPAEHRIGARLSMQW